jgi:hypothetical protein
MTKTIKNTIQAIKRTNIQNNTQRVALRLLNADGQWVPRSRLAKVPSATSRVRDLRKVEFGSFTVECRSSDDLNRRVNKRTYYYRIDPNKVTKQQIDTLFVR